MIKRLRIQFICVTMVLMAALLMTIFSTICQTTWNTMNKEATNALQSASFEPWSPGGMSAKGQYPNYPCFILCVDQNGNMSTKGHAYYDLTDEALLRQIFEAAKATGESAAVLWDWNLKFVRLDLWRVEEYVFTDISGQLQTMKNLYWTCGLVFVVAMVVFFGISWGLAKWMTRPVERALQQQRQFVADASHELKTPLTVILTNAELLQSQDHSPEDRRRFLGAISTMAGQMRGLVESLLELARMDNHQLHQEKRTPVDLSDLAEGCVMDFEPVYYEAGRTLESQVQPNLWVKGSRQHLRQVVDILLDNGHKYATANTVVELSLTQSRGHCQLRVTSQGESLTAKQCKDAFKRFYRVDPARSRDGSYGLGLPIAQGIVREHKGKIWAQSKDGVNAFIVTLPTCQPPKSSE